MIFHCDISRRQIVDNFVDNPGISLWITFKRLSSLKKQTNNYFKIINL